jgi:hypothetical protein
MNLEAGDLVENLDIDNLDHAEKFLIATESPLDGKLDLLCGNGNSWGFPTNGINHGNVVWAYTKARKSLAETNFLKKQLDNCKHMYATLERSRDYYQKNFIDAQKETLSYKRDFAEVRDLIEKIDTNRAVVAEIKNLIPNHKS